MKVRWAGAMLACAGLLVTSGCAAPGVDAAGGIVTEASNSALPHSSTPVDSVEEVPEDDRVISDTMLAWSVAESPSAADIETMRAVATDDALWQEGETATMDFRVWHGASEEGTIVLAARGFGEMAVGLLLGVLCPAGGDAVTEYRDFVEEHARIMVRLPEDE